MVWKIMNTPPAALANSTYPSKNVLLINKDAMKPPTIIVNLKHHKPSFASLAN